MYILGLVVLLLCILSAYLLNRWSSLCHSVNDAQLACSELSGAQCARKLLDSVSLSDVGVTLTDSFFGDHYDPKDRCVRLTQDVYFGNSLNAIGIAAHEVAHAQQESERFKPLMYSSLSMPFFSIASSLALLSLVIGLLQNNNLMIVASVLATVVLFLCRLFYLPVEFDANRRALKLLEQNSSIRSVERAQIAQLLKASASTYLGGLLAFIFSSLEIPGASSKVTSK